MFYHSLFEACQAFVRFVKGDNRSLLLTDNKNAPGATAGLPSSADEGVEQAS